VPADRGMSLLSPRGKKQRCTRCFLFLPRAISSRLRDAGHSKPGFKIANYGGRIKYKRKHGGIRSGELKD
jgi:hypothetical protein